MEEEVGERFVVNTQELEKIIREEETGQDKEDRKLDALIKFIRCQSDEIASNNVGSREKIGLQVTQKVLDSIDVIIGEKQEGQPEFAKLLEEIKTPLQEFYNKRKQEFNPSVMQRISKVLEKLSSIIEKIPNPVKAISDRIVRQELKDKLDEPDYDNPYVTVESATEIEAELLDDSDIVSFQGSALELKASPEDGVGEGHLGTELNEQTSQDPMEKQTILQVLKELLSKFKEIFRTEKTQSLSEDSHSYLSYDDINYPLNNKNLEKISEDYGLPSEDHKSTEPLQEIDGKKGGVTSLLLEDVLNELQSRGCDFAQGDLTYDTLSDKSANNETFAQRVKEEGKQQIARDR